MNNPKLSPTMQLAATFTMLSEKAKEKEQQEALTGRQTIRRPMPRHLEAMVR